MIDFDEILSRLKLLHAQQHNKKKAYDKDIAMILGVTPEYFAVIKKRKKIPYKEIALFCHERKMCINWVLFGESLMPH